MTGVGASRAWRQRCVDSGRCPRCGRAAAPFYECDDCRAWHKIQRQLNRATGYRNPHRQHEPRPTYSKYAADVAHCKHCNAAFSRTQIQVATGLAKCRSCRLKYRHALAARKASGESVAGGPCRLCGEPIHARNKKGAHYKCLWDELLDSRARAHWLAREEIQNPATEEQWLKTSRLRLNQVRNLVRDASRSPTPESRPARTSPS